MSERGTERLKEKKIHCAIMRKICLSSLLADEETAW